MKFSIIKLSLSVLLLLVSSFSYASEVFVQGGDYGVTGQFATGELACQAIIDKANSDGYNRTLNHYQYNSYCYTDLQGVWSNNPTYLVYAETGTCPVGFSDDGSGTCVVDSLCPDAGTALTYWITFDTKNPDVSGRSVNDCGVIAGSMAGGCSFFQRHNMLQLATN